MRTQHLSVLAGQTLYTITVVETRISHTPNKIDVAIGTNTEGLIWASSWGPSEDDSVGAHDTAGYVWPMSGAKRTNQRGRFLPGRWSSCLLLASCLAANSHAVGAVIK